MFIAIYGVAIVLIFILLWGLSSLMDEICLCVEQLQRDYEARLKEEARRLEEEGPR